MKRLFTSEAVCVGHPDKVCDQIADAILDAIIEKDPIMLVDINNDSMPELHRIVDHKLYPLPQGTISAYKGVQVEPYPPVPFGFTQIIMKKVSAEFLINFTIERNDLINDNGSFRYLQLRRSAELGTEQPFFELRLDLPPIREFLQRNREGEGTYDGRTFKIRFDDFVFEINVEVK